MAIPPGKYRFVVGVGQAAADEGMNAKGQAYEQCSAARNNPERG